MKNSSDSGDDARPGALGARRDDSSLFSVAALTKQAQEKAPEAVPRAKEESGIIDIKALALGRKAGSAPSDPPPGLPHADVFNRGSAPILTAPVIARPATVPPAASGSKTPLIIGALVLVAVGAAAATFLAMRGPSEVPTAASARPSAAPVAVVEKAPPPEVTAPAVEAAIPGQLSRKDPAAKASAAPAVKVAGAVPAKAPAATAKATAEAAPEPPPPPVETCDLQCQMQRAVDKKH